MKIAVFLFAVATLLQLSHCIPTHRYARHSDTESQDWRAKIREYMNKIPGYGGSSESQSSPPSNSPDSSYQPSATAGSESAASELHSLIATKEGNTPSNSFPSFGSYMPNYQIPSSINPSQYMSSIPGYPGASSGTAGAASEPEASIAAKEGNPPSNSFPSFGSYMPNYQIPSSMNPSQYMSSIPGYPGASSGTAGAASEPEASIAAKEGNPPSNSFPSFGSYMPNYQIPSSMNPSQYMSSIPGYPGASKPTGT